MISWIRFSGEATYLIEMKIRIMMVMIVKRKKMRLNTS